MPAGLRPVKDRLERRNRVNGRTAELVETEAIVLDTATELRARHGLRVPDALHLACAIVHRCDRFLTNDHRLDRIAEIPIEIFSP